MLLSCFASSVCVFIAFPLTEETAVISIYDISYCRSNQSTHLHNPLLRLLQAIRAEETNQSVLTHCLCLHLDRWQLLYPSFALCIMMYNLLNDSINVLLYVRMYLCLLVFYFQQQFVSSYKSLSYLKLSII